MCLNINYIPAIKLILYVTTTFYTSPFKHIDSGKFQPQIQGVPALKEVTVSEGT